MFEILRKSLGTGVVTSSYPETPASHAPGRRGRPEIDYPRWKDARLAAASCPTGAISYKDAAGERVVTLDLGLCTFCGQCAEVHPVIRMSNRCELAVRKREDLKTTSRYALNPDGTHRALISAPEAAHFEVAARPAQPATEASDELGKRLKDRIERVLGRSLHIREVDAGSCNGCEVEIVGLNSPIYDIERFGIHFVASPRHADMLLVTGPVSRNMELALKKTYEATPPPRVVVAVGACGCGGGIFGVNYASVGGVDQVIPVDVYIPGCPPNPHALLEGILLAVGRLEQRA